MARKGVIFYVFISFLLIGVITFFSYAIVGSPMAILLFAVIFRSIIGTHWKDSFKLAVINYVWILIFSFFFVTAEIMMTLQGQSTSGEGLIWAFFVMIIGIPLTTIVINWTGNKNFDYSLFDKILNRLSNKRHSRHKFYK